MSPRSPRSLADQVREWSTDRLAALLRARPDLGMPAPTDSAQLAARATSRASIWRAYELCDLADRTVLEAIASLDGPAAQDIAPLIGATPSATEAIIDRLSDLLLVWDDGNGLRVPRALAEHVAIPAGPHPSTVAGLITELDAQPRALLQHLVDGSLDGVSTVSPRSPAALLVTMGLLGIRGDASATGDARRQHRVTVTLTTRQHFFGGTITNQPMTPPAVAITEADQSSLDQRGAGSAAVLLRNAEALAESWSRRPPIALKSGGLGVRDFKALSALLQWENHEAAFLVEVLHEAGLIALGEVDADESYEAWMPTVAFDEWVRWSAGARWTHLAEAWLRMNRQPAVVGTRGSSGTVNALSSDPDHPHIAQLRRFIITEWARTAPGTRLASGTGVASLFAAIRWRHPQWYDFDDMALGILAEAAWLGMTTQDGLTSPARALIAHGDAASVLDPLLPSPVDHILVQADLTAIAPGPLEADIARRLSEIANVDSRGGATVYRFTADSVRRGLDSGRTAEDIKVFLQETSKTPLPQALDYLIDDVARRFGHLRVGAASVFLRSDDEVAITALLHDSRATSLRLRRIAPTVLVSDIDPATVLNELREIGAAPVLELADGTVRVARPDAHRAPRARLPQTSHGLGIADARVAATVAAIQSGDRAATARPSSAVVHAPHDIIALLRRTLEANAEVVLSYAGADGTVGQRIVRPLRLEGGRLTAFDERSDLQREFVIHRITAASLAEDSHE